MLPEDSEGHKRQSSLLATGTYQYAVGIPVLGACMPSYGLLGCLAHAGKEQQGSFHPSCLLPRNPGRSGKLSLPIQPSQ